MAASKALRIGAFGATGTGKSAWILQQLAKGKPKRLLVWDFKDDPALRHYPTAANLGDLVRSCSAPAFQLRYLVNHDADIDEQFDLFCRLAWALGNLTMFVDELPEVTKAQKAPAVWRKCVNAGRDPKGLTIIGAGQRLAECDKSFIGNCDVLHIGRLGNMADARQVAGILGVRPEELVTLPNLHWREHRQGVVGVASGVLTFPKK